MRLTAERSRSLYWILFLYHLCQSQVPYRATIALGCYQNANRLTFLTKTSSNLVSIAEE